ncbi:hypothetical protein JW721_06355 [Candidatus Micrarchaeota archaeon]|nr:hypothetical protein [Candidatus Micrarchaeota archaeon]
MAKKKEAAPKIKGSWFNAGVCMLIFAVALIFELGFVDAYLQRSSLRSLEELAGFCISLGYYFLFMGALLLGALFNAVSASFYEHFRKEYSKHPILVTIDNVLDWALWGIAFYGSIAAFLINVIILDLIIG